MCGILGIMSNEPVAAEIHKGLLILQHRGQDAAGIYTFDGKLFHKKKHMGLVNDIFTQEHIDRLHGTMGIGHTRYPTWGSLNLANCQPFMSDTPYGITIAFNGNVYNTEVLRKELQEDDLFMIKTNSDLEIILGILRTNLIRLGLKDKEFRIGHLWKAIRAVQRRCHGGYSIVVQIAGVGMVAFKDPYGIRPVMLGVRKRNGKPDEYCFASESVAFDILGFDLVGDLKNGEAVLIRQGSHEVVRKVLYQKTLRPCVFEHVYFARPDSMINDISVHKTRLRMGRYLGKMIKKTGLKIDVVMPIPDSSREAAVGAADVLGIKYREGLIKNRYVGRTFIMPDQESRRRSVRDKFNPIKMEIQGKDILLVEDSIVRGNTSEQIVTMIRNAGARKVFFASAAPPLRSPCMYGIDLPSKDEFIANQLNVEEIRRKIGADKLFYLELSDLQKAVKEGNPKIKKHCMACFTGEYPTKDVTDEALKNLEGCRKTGTERERELVHLGMTEN